MLRPAIIDSTFNTSTFRASLVFFLAVGVNLIGIDALSLTSDECFSIYHAQMLPRLIHHHLSTGNNPPLFEWLLHYWMLWFGDSAFSVRCLSAIFSSLTAALIYTLGTTLGGVGTYFGGVGAIAALLFMGSNYTAFLAHEARTYNLTLFLGVLSTILFLRAVQSKQKSHWIWYGFMGGILCLSHFFGLWILIAHGTFWLFKTKGKDNFLSNLLWSILGFAITFGWYLPVVWHRFIDSASEGTWVNPAPWNAPYFTLWKYLNTPIAAIIAAILLFYLTLNLVAKKSIAQRNKPKTDAEKTKPDKLKIQLILWLFALPFFGQWILSLDHPLSIPMFTERYASITLPFLCLALALSLTSLGASFSQRTSTMATILFIVTMLVGKNLTPPNQASAKEALHTIQTALEKQWRKTPIILEPYHAAFQVLYYIDHKRFQQYHPESIYPHLSAQLQHSNVWILKTNKTLDSAGLSNNRILAYLHLGSEKSAHTKTIENQLKQLTATGGTTQTHNIQIPKTLWGTWEIASEAEFWLIEKK